MKLREFYPRYAASALGMSPQEAYELQRVLQMNERAADAGLKAGRSGPGGGAEATPFTVGFMMMGALVNGPKSAAIETVWSYWHINQEGSNSSGWVFDDKTGETDPPPHRAECPLTRQPLFGEALRFLLTNPSHAGLVERIEVCRDFEDASIYYRENGEVKRSRFLDEHNKRKAERVEKNGDLRTLAVIGGKAIADIACDLRDNTPAQ